MAKETSVYSDKSEYVETHKIFKNNRAKTITAIIISFLLSFVLWFYVAQAETTDYEKTFDSVNIELKNETSLSTNYSLSVISGFNNITSVSVKGKRSDISNISSADIYAYVDLSAITSEGKYTLPVTFVLPDGISLGSKEAQNVSIYIDKTTTVSVEVKVNATYSKTEDINFEIETNPKTLQISGPASEISQVSYAGITLDLGTLTTDIVARKSIALYTESGNEIHSSYLKSDVSEVVANVSVFKYKTLPLKVKLQHSLLKESDIKFTYSPSKIEVKGSPDAIDKLNSLEITSINELEVDGIREFAGIPIILPSGVESVDGISTVNITASLTKDYSQKLAVSLEEGKNLTVKAPEGTKYVIKTKSLTIKLRGTSTAVSQINADDVEFTLDLSNVTSSGTAAVPVVVNLKDSSDSVYAVGSYNLDIAVEVS